MPPRPPSSPTPALPLNDTADFPDYYRTTRLEEYGPYYRSPTQPQDTMKTIDLRYDSREFTASFLLPDILEEYELDSNESLGGGSLSASREVRATPAAIAITTKTPSFVIRILSSVWRKCRARRFISRHGSKYHGGGSNSQT